MRLQTIALLIGFALLGILGCRPSAQRDFPIDLVYLWVDGSDPVWRQKKEYWQKQLGITVPYAVSDARFRDREELKHSLRSVEKYLPWVRTVYIVTDNQIPSWLNTRHPKIKVVFHQEIFPPEALPVFNSSAIETRLAYIPGLAEHFIYTNDDVFVNKPLTPDFFFTPDGKPIYYSDERVAKQIRLWLPLPANKLVKEISDFNDEVFEKVYHMKPQELAAYGDTHTMTAYRKSDYLENGKILGDYWKNTTYSKFRTRTDLHRGMMVLPDHAKGKNIIKNALNLTQFHCGVSGYMVVWDVDELRTENPCLFCLNDAPGLSEEDSWAHTQYLRKRFPKKSKFEK